MAHFAEANIPGIVAYSSVACPFTLENIQAPAKADFQAIFEEHRHRIYSLAFWMTDNEMTAEEISSRVFLHTFHQQREITGETIDNTLVQELRDYTRIGVLSLDQQPVVSTSVAGNTKRIHLERAVVEVPATERLAFLMHDVEGYDHARIARTLGITEEESRKAVFQARLLIRELVAQMIG